MSLCGQRGNSVVVVGGEQASCKQFSNDQFLMKLAYLSDIFGKVTESNLQLEGTDKHLPHLADKTNAFTQNLGMWGRRLDQGNTDSFENLNGFAENSD